MATGTLPSPSSTRSSDGFLRSKRGRVLIENITAYLFIAPAALIIFLFALFPVGFALFVSLHRWRRNPDDFRGLDNYVEAIGHFAFVIFFWIAVLAIVFALHSIWRLIKQTREERAGLFYLIPGVFIALAVITFVNWFFRALYVILNVPVRLRGQETNSQIFIDELFNSFKFPDVLDASYLMLLAVGAAIVAGVLTMKFVKLKRNTHYLFLASLIFVALLTGVFVMQLTIDEINIAIDEARETDETLDVWAQIILISAGVVVLYAAYRLWGYTTSSYNDRNFIITGLVAVLLIIGGYLLVSELPRALGEADDDVLQGFNVTIMYALFSVPIQLALGLGLSVLLFQNIKGKSIFRLIYFLPYITPFVATSLVFTLIFARRDGSPINTFIGIFGGEARPWLTETDGIFEILLGRDLPGILGGPGLALFVIIMFNVWVYAGYSTVIFLAGLGNISNDLYEAARIDGANGWRVFRHITLPLLSPTTFFLTLIATIGTLQAFTQIFLLRQNGAFDAVDTINLYIYQEVTANNPDYAYGSAMSFVLFIVILLLTLFQNRLLGRKVFYG